MKLLRIFQFFREACQVKPKMENEKYFQRFYKALTIGKKFLNVKHSANKKFIISKMWDDGGSAFQYFI